MIEDTEIPEVIKVKKPLDRELANELTAEIHNLHSDEIKFLARANGPDTTSEDRLNDFEEAYLANFKKIKLAKRFTKEQYIEYELEKQCCCDYDSLETPDWEDVITAE